MTPTHRPVAKRRPRLRDDGRPRLAEACRVYADAWSVYVHWDYSKRVLAKDNQAVTTMENYFRGRLVRAGRALREAYAAVWPTDAVGVAGATEPGEEEAGGA